MLAPRLGYLLILGYSTAFVNITLNYSIRYAVRGEEVARGSKITDNIIIGTPGKVKML